MSQSGTATKALHDLRKQMNAADLDFVIVPNSDPYLNEYVLDRCRWLRHLIEFDSSAGTVIVGRNQVTLFVDGRYHLQAQNQFGHTNDVELQLLGRPNALSPTTWLMTREPTRAAKLRLGYDPEYYSQHALSELNDVLVVAGLDLVEVELGEMNDVSAQAAHDAIETVPDHVTGQSTKSRLALVRSRLKSTNCDGTVITKLDQIAWLLGMRGRAIDFNPVFEARAIITQEICTVYTRDELVSPIQKQLSTDFQVKSLKAWQADLGSAAKSISTWYLDDRRLNSRDFSLVSKNSSEFTTGIDLIEQLKAIKTQAETNYMRRAGVFAGIAKWRARCWLNNELKNGKCVTEAEFASVLQQKYSELPDYRGLSFGSIVGAGLNSAIIHYSSPSHSAQIQSSTPLLVDSGAHYLGGTTDATRVFCFSPSDEFIRQYTLCLKSHIAGAALTFPKGTLGVQIDAIIRAPLWTEREDYLHGTGHGVGAYLNVHEGPMLIGLPGRSGASDQEIEAGQILSIEPGIYHQNFAGVRLENLYSVSERGVGQNQRTFLGFDTLTFIPFEYELCDTKMLTNGEKKWLIRYHKAIIDTLEPRNLKSAYKVEFGEPEYQALVAACQKFCQLES